MVKDLIKVKEEELKQLQQQHEQINKKIQELHIKADAYNEIEKYKLADNIIAEITKLNKKYEKLGLLIVNITELILLILILQTQELRNKKIGNKTIKRIASERILINKMEKEEIINGYQ